MYIVCLRSLLWWRFPCWIYIKFVVIRSLFLLELQQSQCSHSSLCAVHVASIPKHSPTSLFSYLFVFLCSRISFYRKKFIQNGCRDDYRIEITSQPHICMCSCDVFFYSLAYSSDLCLSHIGKKATLFSRLPSNSSKEQSKSKKLAIWKGRIMCMKIIWISVKIRFNWMPLIARYTEKQPRCHYGMVCRCVFHNL